MKPVLSRLAFHCSRALLLLAAGLSTLPPAMGQIVADPSAPKNQQPVIVPTANGLPQVNIQTPSAAGVSRNNYTQFDVQQQGAILNNARSNVQTQLGGWVQANPNLSNGTARIILNQVNSSNPSLLGGTVEVAGDRAQVIIANPSGITCDGCGFINANRATLTTGTPIFNGANLSGYQVNGGNVIVQGAGLNASQADYTDIIARAAQINAGIWSKELRVTTGINQVSADNTQATASSPTGPNPAPSFAVDVAQLGGMYANKIVLVGTEAGVGMRNAGTLGASGGDLILQSNGMLTNSGNLQASANVQITTQGDFSNSSSAKVYAGANQTIHVSGQLSNSGTLVAQGNNSISAASLNSSAGSTLAAGLQADGTAVASNPGSTDLSVTTSGSLIAHGSNLAAGNLSLSGSSTDISNSQTSAANISLTASNGDVTSAAATVTSSGNLNITANSNATQTLNNTQGQLSAAQLNLQVANLNNQSGTLQQSGSGDTTLAVQTSGNQAGSINNSNGTIATNGNNLSISASSLNNTGGKIAHSGVSTGSASITVAQGIDNTSGSITSNAAASTINAQSLTNTSGSINVTGSLGITLDSSVGALSNQQGSVVANYDVSISAARVDNTQGTIASAQGNLGIASSGSTSNDSGTLQSALDMTLTNTGLSNASAAQASTGAGSISARNLSVHTGNQQFNNTGGTVIASQTLNLQTGALNNTGGLLQSGSDLALNTNGAALTNSNAAAYVSSSHSSNSSNSSNSNTSNTSLNGQGGIVAQGQALLSTGNWFNNSGYVGSKGKLSAVAVALDNSGGQVQVNDQINLTIGSGTFENAGVLHAATSLTVTAPNISNTVSGELSATQTQLNASGTLTNRGLIDGSDTHINAVNVSNIGSGRIYGDTLSIAATNLSNDTETVNGSTQAGVIAARTRLDIGVSNLTNREHAVLYSAGDMAIGGSLDSNRQATGSATTVNNNSATMEAAGALNIASASINNTNDHLRYQVVVDRSYAANDYVQGDGTVIPGNTVAFILNYPSPGYSMGTGRLILASAGITAAQVRYYNTPDAISPGYCPGGDRDCDPPSVYYRANDPIWSFFNVAPGGLDAAAALQDQINALQAKLQAAIVPFYVWRDYTETTHKAQVSSTDPGRIASGGAMTLNAGTQLLNNNSNILAGGALNVTGAAVTNQALQVSVDTTRSGTSKDYAIVGRDCGGFFSGCSDVWQTRTMAYNASTPSTVTLSVAQSAGNTAFIGTTSGAAALTNGNSSRNGAILVYPGIANADGSTSIVRTSNQPIQLPNASLYQLNPAANANYLVATDPRFTNQQQWLSSSYLTQQLNVDPSLTQKRLGDGFYEQQLVSQQVAQLTGRRFLDNYSSDEAQYQALMNNAITFAKQTKLQPGIALTAQQVAQLTSDIVWLVQQTVTLADGSTQTVLVPQVYVRAQAGDLDGSGSLLTGNSVNLQLSGDLNNSGQIAGRQVLQLNANNVTNLGSISSDSVSVAAQQDLNTQGGSISATSSLTATAGRDLTVQSTTQSTSTGTSAQTTVDRIAGLYVTGSNGSLSASAGGNLHIAGAVVSNQGTGATSLSAGNNLTLSTLTTSSSSSVTWSEGNDARQSQSKEIGSQVSGGGDVSLSAGNDLTARAATLQAGSTSTLKLSAGNDMNLIAGQSTYNSEVASQYSGGGWLNKHAYSRQRSLSIADAIVSQLNGGTVNVSAGHDLVSQGTTFSGTQAVSVSGANSQRFYAAQNVQQSSDNEQSSSSLFGIFRTKKTVTDQQSSTTSIASSLLSTQKIDVHIGNEASFYGANVSADQISFHQADPNKAGQLLLGGSIDSSQSSHTEKSETGSVWQAQSGHGSTIETLNQTQLKGNVSFDNGLKISAQIPQGDWQTQIATLGTQGGLTYLTGLANNSNVQWQQVALAHDNWRYSQQGLTPAGAALLAIAVAAYTGGMGSGLLGTTTTTASGGSLTTLAGSTLVTTSATGAVTSTALGTAINAGFASLAAQASVAMVNNGGDIGKTLQELGSMSTVKNLATTMVTAGVLANLDQALGLTDSVQSATGQTGSSAVSSVNGVATSQAANQFSQNLLKNLVNNLAGSVIAAGMNGQPLNEQTLTGALSNALITAGMASGANAIGDAATSQHGQAAQINGFTQDLAHAILGCAGGAASAGNSSGCAPGAVGAVVGEMAAQYINPTADPAQAAQTIAFAKTMSAIAGVLVGGGDNADAVNIAATTGANAAENNQLAHSKNMLSLASQCGAGQPPCTDEKINAINQAQGVVDQAALSNMKTMAPYVVGTAGVAAFGTEAIMGGTLAGAFDYGGDTLSYMMGLSKDPPSFSKSYTTGIIGGMMTPLAIADKAISGMSMTGKIVANGYNALVTGTSAAGAAVYTNQDNPGVSAGFGAGSSVLGTGTKTMFPGSTGNIMNYLIQGLSGPAQNYMAPSK